jgi:hypothetical protein
LSRLELHTSRKEKIVDRLVSFLNNRYIIAIMVALFLLSFLRTMGITRR